MIFSQDNEKRDSMKQKGRGILKRTCGRMKGQKVRIKKLLKKKKQDGKEKKENKKKIYVTREEGVGRSIKGEGEKNNNNKSKAREQC